MDRTCINCGENIFESGVTSARVCWLCENTPTEDSGYMKIYY